MAAPKHRVLIVGAGSIGERHTRCFLKTERATVGVCETRRDIRERIAFAYALDAVYGDLEAALNDPWDVVLIATPANTHIPIALRAVETNAALLIEKPLSVSLDDVDRLCKAVRDRGLTAAVSYNYRAHPGVCALKARLSEGRLGAPLQLVFNAGQDFAHYRPAYAGTYFADPATGGGALQDALTHHLNLGAWLVGDITHIAADGAHQRLDGVSVEDTVSVMARHGNVPASYSLNLYQKANELTVTVVCEKGMFRFELHEHRVRRMEETDGPWIDEAYPLDDRDSWYVLNAHAFLDAVEGKSEPLCTLDEGVETLRATLAAQAAMREPQWREVTHGA